jgi:hypothetical protein
MQMRNRDSHVAAFILLFSCYVQIVNAAGCCTAGLTLQFFEFDNYADAQSQFTFRFVHVVDFVLSKNCEYGGMRYGGARFAMSYS